MPSVVLPEHNLKFLIDTGSSRSFLDPAIAEKYYKEYIHDDPFVVTSMFCEEQHSKSVTIPISKIFNDNNINLKYYLLKFSKNFDGLIGIDHLKALKCQLCLDENLLITPNAKIPINYNKNENENLNYIEVEARTQKVIKVKTNIKNGTIIIPYTKINGCEIPECLTNAENGYAVTTIINADTNSKTININDEINCEKYSVTECEINSYEINNNKYQDFSQIDMNHLNSEEKFKLLELLKEFPNIFYNENEKLTFTNAIKHKVRTTDEIPVYTKSYRLPFAYKKEVNNQIKKMLEQNIIVPSQSPWSAPLWLVPKKSNTGEPKWRVVIDYRKLNEKTIGDKYPLPDITETLDRLGKCNYYTTLDLASGFHQIQMDKSDQEKTAFNTERGHYEFIRMPFGLRNAPATFQRVMDNILRGVQDEGCLIYIDDLIVYSSSLEEHIKKLREVFSRLQDTNLKIQLPKCNFLRSEVAYLGHVITPEGVKPNPGKIEAIKKFPLPQTQKDIRSFLGLFGYYRRFINNYAHLTKPFTNCLKKGHKVIHDNTFLNAFETCKNILTNEPILQYPDFDKPFVLTTDASNVALGAILSQGPIGKDLPVAYASRTLNNAEHNYSTVEKELLAIVWATEHFRPYLYGRKFKIVTDHQPLQWLFNLKNPNSKLARWRIRLEEFDFEIMYKKGVENTNADALSRITINAKEVKNLTNEELEEIADKLVEVIDTEKFQEMSNSEIDECLRHLVKDELDQISNIATCGDNEEDIETQHSAEEYPTVSVPISEAPINYGQNQIVFSKVFNDPSPPVIQQLFKTKQRFLVQLSQNNFENDVLKFIKEYIVPKVTYYLLFEDEQQYKDFCETVRKFFKYPSYSFKRCETKLIDVLEENEQEEITENYHCGKTNHRGINETEERIKRLYYWPNIKQTVQKFINNCEVCLQTKYERNPLKLKLNITPTPSTIFEIVHLDTFTVNKQKFLTIIDAFSKYAQAYAINSNTPIEIVNKLILFFSHHGIPKLFVTDNGLEFKNGIITDLLKLHKIEIHYCTPYHPQSNGLIERLHSTLLEQIRILNMQDPNQPIEIKMSYAILAYNLTIHSSTKFKPLEIINGQIEDSNPFNLDLEQAILSDYVSNHKEKCKLLYKKINEKLTNYKSNTILQANKNREEPTMFRDKNQITIKNSTREKTANKFKKPQEITDINEQSKVVIISDKNVSMDNAKRPRN